MPLHWKWTLVDPTLTQIRADRLILSSIELNRGEWIPEKPPSLSRTQIQAWIESGLILANGRPFKSNTCFSLGTEFTVTVPDPQPIDLTPDPTVPFEILYEDDQLAVINKPPGITVHPSETQTHSTLVHGLLSRLTHLSGIGGILRPGIVHRIDKDTSGILVVSKTDTAHHHLSEQFSTHSIERRYWAICYGCPRPGTISTLIGRDPNDRKKMSCTVREGKKAETHISVLEKFGTSSSQIPFASLIEAKLETGRTHQVRVHLNHLHSSLLGDPVYGTPTSNQAKFRALPETVQNLLKSYPGQLLHARVLGFIHPTHGQFLRFEIDPPSIFSQVHNHLRPYILP